MTLKQIPIAGSSNIYRCGDIFQLMLTVENDTLQPYLRTSLGGSRKQQAALIINIEEDRITSRNNWKDIPFDKKDNNQYIITLPLYEVGHFEAKVWLHNPETNETIWTSGDNVHIKVEPASTVANNSIYGVFTRQFGPNKEKLYTMETEDRIIKELDRKGYHVIPPSGTFRDIIKELDHIMDNMGFRILQLLPIHPTPTTYARMGRFGSPYAALDFFAVNPSLADFDKHTTPLDQFIELVDEVHHRDGQIFIDIPVDHTGWASTLQKDHPEYFAHDENGGFVSPGAWGTTWEDLVKLDFSKTEVHQLMADVFLYWCRNGVDGFRCDAGYMVPFEAWEYIIAKVRNEFPNTIFLLEGLGGPPEVTEHLLSRSTFSWAYSELFQNYNKDEVMRYIDNMLRINNEKGGLVNFSETHDNLRLAATSETWSRMRNLLCALTAPAGAFGISNGVEFFAQEKISVHHACGLNWNSENNQIELFKRITELFKTHPAFLANASIEIVHNDMNDVFTCKRTAANGDSLFIIVNLNCEKEQPFIWTKNETDSIPVDLLSGNPIKNDTLAPGEALCIDTSGKYSAEQPYIDALQLQIAKETLHKIHAHFSGFDKIAFNDIEKRLDLLKTNPLNFCLNENASLAQIVKWDINSDANRMVMATENSVLLIESESKFDYKLAHLKTNLQSGKAIIKNDNTYFALIPLCPNERNHIVHLDIKINHYSTYGKTEHKTGKIALLPENSDAPFQQVFNIKEVKEKQIYALCTNQYGSMAQVSGIWSEYLSKYDCFFGVNLDAKVPVDRTVMISRWRCWVVCNDFSHELGLKSQYRFAADGATHAIWSFKAPTGQGQYVLIDIHLNWANDTNQATLSFVRKNDKHHDDLLDAQTPVTIICRPNVEYRCNHETTKAYLGAEKLFPSKTEAKSNGFIFNPYDSTPLTISSEKSFYTHEPEWHYMHHLPVEENRGLEHCTDFYSPGYFKFLLKDNEKTALTASTDNVAKKEIPLEDIPLMESQDKVLKRSINRYIVRRDDALTVIAGYPWFLDWGRDTLICLRGIIAADMQQEAKDIILTFAKYEEDGTLPNMIRGNNAGNRDTSDAPLWFIIAIKDYIEHFGDSSVLDMKCADRTVKEVIKSIIINYANGTHNGIRMDKDSGLIYSPSHFTWMDTNYPAGTPREGYPIEIQAFWQASVSYLSSIDNDIQWQKLATQIHNSILSYYPLSEKEGFSDCLHCQGFQPASKAIKDDACRPNQLFAVTLSVVKDEEYVKSILLATQHLIFPGSIRSLRDSSVSVPLEVNRDGQILNDPYHPYWGNYCGDEDTRRKPAYHNGTGWSWPFFSYCEALYMYSNDQSIALAILMSAKQEMEKGIINHMPEISDGNTPHRQRGCGAQAWSITEYYRVLKEIRDRKS